MIKLLAFALSCLLALAPCALAGETGGADETVGAGEIAQGEALLSDEEITRLLWEMYQSENGDADFMVLPDDFQEPAAGRRGVYNLLLLGVDTDEGSLKGRSDTMLLASFNALRGELKLISFMRDTYVAIPGSGRNRLNAAYAYGGTELLKKTLYQCFGVTVDGCVAVNYSLMLRLVDAIGGVELTVSQDELKKLNGILEYYNYQRGVPEEQGRLAQPGTQILTGLQTMSYARIRKLDSDFVRVERQQKVILAIYQKLLSLPLPTLTNVMMTYIGEVGTDVTIARAVSLLAAMLDSPEIAITTLRVPTDGAYKSQLLNGAYYLVPNLNKCQQAIADFLAE